MPDHALETLETLESPNQPGAPAISFVVRGHPEQRGSKIAAMIPKRGGGFVERNGRPILVARDANAKSRDWMRAVADAARLAYGGELLAGPVRLSCRFFFARPKSHYRTGKYAAELRDSAPRHHDQKPDLDKLLRCLADALTGQIWRDDAQVAEYGRTGKRWTRGGEGARVTIERL